MIKELKFENNIIRYIEDEKMHAAHSYITLNSWYDSKHLVTVRLSNLKDKEGDLVLTDIETGTETKLASRAAHENYTIHGDKIFNYFDKHVTVFDIKTGIQKMLCSLDEDAIYRGMGITNDGKTISLAFKRNRGNNTIQTLDTETGEVTHVMDITFPYGHEDVSHCMINPENKNQIFFCHEGFCAYIANRLWMIKDGKAQNIFKQKMDSDGNCAQHCGHEMWDFSGKGMYFILYPSTSVDAKGVWYIDAKTYEAKPVASSYPYWHVGVSHGGNLLMADTQKDGEYSDVILINQKTKEEKKMFSARTNWVHPTHPHPVFSPDDSKVCFSFLNDDGKLCTGWMDTE